jgi:hypothetical protein
MTDAFRGLPDGAWESLSQWQKSLVAKKREADDTPPAERAAAQQEFLRATGHSAHTAADALRNALRYPADQALDIPTLKTPLGVADIQTPAMTWEQMLHKSLAQPETGAPATRADAAQVLFWVACSLRWLESDGLEGSPVAMFTKKPVRPLLPRDPSSLAPVDRLVLDDGTRDVLRGIGGIPHVRTGLTHHLLDCPAARAWWRVEIAEQAAAHSDGTATVADCHEVLLDPGCWRGWTTTAMTMAGRLSAGPCVAAFIAAARAHQDREGALPRGKEVGEIASNIVRRSSDYYAGMLDHRTLARLGE